MLPTSLRAALAAGAGVIVLLMPTAASAEDDRGDGGDRRGDRGERRPLIIGHRGASGYRPEHTLASYALAARMGADYIEPDLVSTKDGVLVARHENEISTTTNVADKPEFAVRKTTKNIDGISLTGWFTEDFTLAELKTLRATERIPQLRPRNTAFNGRYTVPTFQEILDLRARLSRELGREVGVYPETKHPTYFQGIGLPLEQPLVRALRRNDLDHRNAPVFVQSFETGNLKVLGRRLRVPIVQLLSSAGAPFDLVASGSTTTYADLSTAAGLRQIARYADGVGPSKDQIVPRAPAGSTEPPAGTSLAPTTFVADAHAARLLVHPYTFRAENAFLPLELRSSADPAAYGNLFTEIEQFFGLGVDGVFTDNPDFAVEVRNGVEG
jgi:glycerophosphoryl diester phosphodiesterase